LRLRGNAIKRPTFSREWIAGLILLSPGLLFVLLVVVRSTRCATIRFIVGNWGNVASVWGLLVSFYVYLVAKGARKAAEEARSAERLRTALVGIEDAASKSVEIGQHARNRNWDVVELRAQEVMACCRTTLAAWGENPSLKDSRRKLTEVATLMRSIIEESRSENVNRETILRAQLDSDEKLSVVIGKIQHDHKFGSE
jgi:hypothetical protein